MSDGPIDPFTGCIYNSGAQGMRTKYEQSLPEYVRNQLDMARGGFDIYGSKMPPEQAQQFIRTTLAPVFAATNGQSRIKTYGL